MAIKKTSQRGPAEIMFDVAKAILDGRSLQTHIMYAATLSYEQLFRYLQVMKDAGLVEEVPVTIDTGHKNAKQWSLTKRGSTWFQMQSEAFELAKGGNVL